MTLSGTNTHSSRCGPEPASGLGRGVQGRAAAQVACCGRQAHWGAAAALGSRGWPSSPSPSHTTSSSLRHAVRTQAGPQSRQLRQEELCIRHVAEIGFCCPGRYHTLRCSTVALVGWSLTSSAMLASRASSCRSCSAMRSSSVRSRSLGEGPLGYLTAGEPAVSLCTRTTGVGGTFPWPFGA